jgi:hypothetical protein
VLIIFFFSIDIKILSALILVLQLMTIPSEKSANGNSVLISGELYYMMNVLWLVDEEEIVPVLETAVCEQIFN